MSYDTWKENNDAFCDNCHHEVCSECDTCLSCTDEMNCIENLTDEILEKRELNLENGVICCDCASKILKECNQLN